MKIVCIGGGPGGLYFATLMKRRNPSHDVTVFERNPRSTAYGFGVVLWDSLLAQLDAADPASAHAVRGALTAWAGQDLYFRESQRTFHGGGYAIGRSQLTEVLATQAEEEGVRLQFETPIADVEQFSDADIVVAADGANSATRSSLGDFEADVHVGRNRYIWLGTEQPFERFTYAFEETAAGWIWFHAYRFAPGMSTCIVECPPGTWEGLGFGSLGSRDTLSKLEGIFGDHLGGHPLLQQQRWADDNGWTEFRRIENERWSAGKVVLLGDAAHTTHFTIGQGVQFALEDAMALAEALGGARPIAEALKTYERERKGALRRPQQEAQRSAEWFEAIPRYAAYAPSQFATLLSHRSSPVLHQLGPDNYLRFRGLLRAASSAVRRVPVAAKR